MTLCGGLYNAAAHMSNPPVSPEIPAALLSFLDGLYPESCPSLKDDERTVWFKAGQRDVVNTLRFHKQQQEESGKIPLPLNLL